MVAINDDALSDIGCNIVSGVVAEKIIAEDKENKHLFINVYTLYRNFVSCLDGDAESKIRMFKQFGNLKKIHDLFIKDTLEFVNVLTTNGVNVTIYELDYSKLSKTFNFKNANEFKGLRYYLVTTQDGANKVLKEAMSGIYKVYTTKLEHVKDMYITTHIGLDLLPLIKHKDVCLIESHTGEIKDNLKWYSKLRKYGNNDMSLIPFNEATYHIYGDNEFIKPEPIPTRKVVYEIAKGLHWYQGLRSNDVLSGITRKDRSLGNKLKSFMKLIF